MKDPRLTQLAHNIVHYACAVQPGENVLIESIGFEKDFVTALIDETYAVGGHPFVNIKDPSVNRALMMHCDDEQLTLMSEAEQLIMRNMQCYIGIRSGDNLYATRDVPADKLQKYSVKFSEPVHTGIRVPHTRWVVLRYPTASMAQAAGMPTELFEDHYFNVCNLDYSKMSKAMDALKERMKRTDKVRIVGPGTDLSFSIKGMPAVKCDGKCNIPDGEIYTAPIKNSVNGVLSYNTASQYQGTTFERIRFVFKDGKIVEATANETEKCNFILDTDEGARYIGEFAIGVNPYITEAIKDTLFDEKIAGSFHFTPGCAYDDCDNGNKSAVHWDLVCIQTPEYGGGEMYFDDELIRKDGLFVPEYLHCLNPENLK